MIKQFTLYDGLFILALYFKLTNTGLVLSWWLVFAPFYVEAIILFISKIGGLFGVVDRVKFFLWKYAMAKQVAKAAKLSAKQVDDWFKKGGKSDAGTK